MLSSYEMSIYRTQEITTVCIIHRTYMNALIYEDHAQTVHIEHKQYVSSKYKHNHKHM